MKISEKELRATVRNLIKENMGGVEKDPPYNRKPGPAAGGAPTEEELLGYLARIGLKAIIPIIGTGRSETEAVPPEEEVPPADIAADLKADQPTEEPDEALEEEVVEVSDEILQEARRRRARRAARRAARKAAAAPAAPAPKAAPPAPKAEPAKAAAPAKKKAEPKKEVIAKKAPAKEKKAVKEWYGEELFGKLLKEAVK